MKKKLCAFLLFISSIVFAQSKNYLDELILLENKISSKQFLDTILKIEYDKAMVDAKKYFILAEKAEKIALKLNDKNALAKAYEALSLYYHFTSKTDLAIANTIKASKIYESLNETEKQANSFINLGFQLKERDLNKAFFYMLSGIKVLEKKQITSQKLSEAYNNYGVLQQRRNELDSALYYHKKSLFIDEKNNDSIGIPFAQTHIAEVFMKKKRFDEAEKKFTEALQIRLKRNDIYGITDSYLYLADLFYAKKEFEKAIFYFKKGEELSIKNSYFPLRKYAAEYLYKSYEQKGDLKNSFKYYKIFNNLKDSTLNKETNAKVAELEIEYQSAIKEKEIAQQKEVVLAQELAIKNRDFYLALITFALLFLGVIFFSIYKKNQFQKAQLQKEIDLKDALATIKTQNRLQEQRLKISRDLHDNIGAQLTFIISSLDNLKYLSKDANDSLKEKLSNISSFTSDTIFQLRDTIWAMNKTEISVEDLHTRVLSFVQKAKKAVTKTEFDINYNIDTNVGFSSLIGINIFRVIQEAINNAIKYAEAKKISIHLHKDESIFKVSIIDDGKGFDIKKVDLGNGLANMEQRISEINAAISIDSIVGKGTKITIEIPLKNETQL